MRNTCCGISVAAAGRSRLAPQTKRRNRRFSPTFLTLFQRGTSRRGSHYQQTPPRNVRILGEGLRCSRISPHSSTCVRYTLDTVGEAESNGWVKTRIGSGRCFPVDGLSARRSTFQRIGCVGIHLLESRRRTQRNLNTFVRLQIRTCLDDRCQCVLYCGLQWYSWFVRAHRFIWSIA